jgi:Peptidase family M23/Domain of unknown function (DUF4280)
MAKGEVIVDGATFYCSMSVANNSEATAVPFKVTSQKKYFGQGKLIATTKDNALANFGNNKGFGNCNNGSSSPPPCAVKATFRDFYKNVQLDGVQILIDKSQGDCKACGVPGIIKVAKSGQTKAVSQIDVKAADAFSIVNTSPQWESLDVEKADKVKGITMVTPFEVQPSGTYYYIEEDEQNTDFAHPLYKHQETFVTLKADYEGDDKKIVWALYKGKGTTDKIKTFIGIGANIRLKMSKLFEDLDEGNYHITAYFRSPIKFKAKEKAKAEKFFLNIEYIKDKVTTITAPGKSLVKNISIPISIAYRSLKQAEEIKILNYGYMFGVRNSPVAIWRVKQGETVLYHSGVNTNTSLVDLRVATSFLSNMPVATVTFKNAGTYTVEAYTNLTEKPHSVTIIVAEKYGINTIKYSDSGLLRHTDMLKVSVGTLNVDYAPGGVKNAQWHLQKNEVWLKTFSDSAVSKTTSINKKVNELLQLDAGVYGGEYFGTYVIEAYANAIGKDKKPDFSSNDSHKFEVIRNEADKITMPQSFPIGSKVKYEVSGRIMPLIATEKIKIEVPEGVTNNNDGTLTFSKQGEFTITAHMTGPDTNDKKVSVKVKVNQPELKHALWSYATGQKRTETGYKEETYGYVEIAGLENQNIIVKVWVKGENENFYEDPEKKYLLEEKNISLNDKGKGQFMITTSDKYKELIDCAIPKTSNVNPKHSLVFTIAIPPSTGNVILPEALHIEHANYIEKVKLYEVLTAREELNLISEQKIKAITFSTEDSKDQQRGLTHYGKSHKIWVHTVNMQDEELQIEVMTNTHSDCMDEKDGIIKALDSIKSYPKEKVGADGLLELNFTLEQKYATDAETNPTYYSIQVAQKAKDPADPKKEILLFIDDQLMLKQMANATLVRSEDLKSVGIRTDKTGLTKEEKVALRKRFLAYKHTALMVTDSTKTVEAVENTDVLVTVDDIEDIEVAEITKGVCECESYRLYYGKNVTCEFRKKVMTISKDLWPSNYKEMANGLMAVMYRETGGSLASNQIEGKPNSYKIAKDKMTKAMFEKTDNKGKPSSRAVGLVQFTQNSLVSMKEFEGGKGYDILHELKLSYARMTEVDQLSKVKKYMQSVKSLPKVPEDIYVAVFAPDYVGKNKDTVMYKKGTNDYDSNSSLDKDNNGIQVKELLGAFHTSLAGGLGGSIYTCKNSEKKESEGDCPENKCIHYADVVDNPRINDQSNNVNKNRYFRVQRINKKHPKGYYHTGVDILASLNTPLKSLLCGTIIDAYDTGGDLGKIVTIKSKDNDDKDVWIRYCHLSSIDVEKDDVIKHGEEIGKSGNTGNAIDINVEYYHVHVEASIDGIFKEGHRVDPELYMKTKFDETTEGNPIK